MAYPKIIHNMSTNTPMMIRANSILGIVSITSFMLQISCISTKEGEVFHCSNVAFIPKRCRIPMNTTPFWLFLNKDFAFSWYFTKNGYTQFESFCAVSVDWKPLHSVGEQPSFVLKIR